MKPLEELADEYIAEAKEILATIKRLEKKLKVAESKKKTFEAIDLKKKIIDYTVVVDDLVKNAYKLKNYYKPKEEWVDIDLEGGG